MSNPKTLTGTHNSTSSLASDFGLLAFDWQAGPTTARSGPGAALASRSAAPANGGGTPTSATSGPRGSGSSASAALAWWLGSRCRARLPYAGGMEYRLTWKLRVTPAGRSISALRASARRTSASDCSGWRSPQAANAGQGPKSKGFYDRCRANHQSQIAFTDEAELAGWPTPTTEDHKSVGPKTFAEYDQAIAENRPVRTSAQRLRNHAELAGWPMPNAMEGGATSRGGDRKDELLIGGLVAGWATPAARDEKGVDQNYHDGAVNNSLPNQAAALGQTPAGLSAATGRPAESRPALNWRFAAWLMGIPQEVRDSLARSMRTYSRSRRRKRAADTSSPP